MLGLCPAGSRAEKTRAFIDAIYRMNRALGIPENMFTVMFALARLPGWIAHWKEMIGMNTKIVRPRQIYIGKRCKTKL